MVFCKTLVFGILIANGLLPAIAKNGLPRSRFPPKYVKSLYSNNPQPNELNGDSRYFKDDDNFYRRDHRIYILKLDRNSLLLKMLGELPLQNTQENYELPVKKTLAMLPLVNYDNSDDENDVNRLGVTSESNVQWAELFDRNGMYLNNPRERVKSGLRSGNTNTPGWDVLNRFLNQGLAEERNKANPNAQVYKFSDLVL